MSRAGTSRWDRWAQQPTGVALRVVFGVLGSATGLVLVWVAYFGASFKRNEPRWNSETLVLLALGLAVVTTTVLAALRPTKRNTLIGLLMVALVPVTGALL